MPVVLGKKHKRALEKNRQGSDTKKEGAENAMIGGVEGPRKVSGTTEVKKGLASPPGGRERLRWDQKVEVKRATIGGGYRDYGRRQRI